MQLFKRLITITWDFVETTVFALGFFLVVYLFLFQTGEVHGASSYPTWMDNDRFITDKFSYRFMPPERGDFVVIKSPDNPDIQFLKRIVGLPEEKITIINGQVYINNILLEEPYLSTYVTQGTIDLIIPANYYFVMGDNRSHSSDSRHFGPIKKSAIIGKVMFRFWPMEKFGQNF